MDWLSVSDHIYIYIPSSLVKSVLDTIDVPPRGLIYENFLGNSVKSLIINNNRL